MEGDSEVSSGDAKEQRPGPARRPIPHHHRPPRPKIFQCPHCERSFDRPSLLGQHVLIHTGERPHKCPKCDDKRFSRTSNLYRHMRTCKGTASSKSPTDEAFRSQVRLANSSATPASERATSSRSTSPAPSVASYPSSSPLQYALESVRGISPDPNWGPNPLASWQPSKRRHTLPSSFPMPISQRIYVPNLLPNLGPSPTTTPSPASLSLVAASSGTPTTGSESRTSVSAQIHQGFAQQQQRDQHVDWLSPTPASRPRSLLSSSPPSQDCYSPSSGSAHSAIWTNSLQPDGRDLVGPALLDPNVYSNHLITPSPSQHDALSIAMNNPSTDGESLRYVLMMKNAVPSWTPSPPPALLASSHLTGMNNAGDMCVPNARVLDSQEDVMQREQDAQGERLWDAYVNLE